MVVGGRFGGLVLLCLAVRGRATLAFVGSATCLLQRSHDAVCRGCLSSERYPNVGLRTGGSHIPYFVNENQQGRQSCLRMSALGPIGPFTPFRSTYCSSGVVDREMAELSSLAEEMTTRFGKLVLGFQTGVLPPKAEVAKIAEEMRTINEQWRILLTRLSLAPDFQALQLFKLTEARLKSRGFDMAQMQEAMQWQVESMLAYANDRPPPPMPASMVKMAQSNSADAAAAAARGGGGGGVFGGGMPSRGPMGVTALPFVEGSAAVSSPLVREELDALVREHKELVRLGEAYGRWDRVGRRAYIEQLEAVEERWGVFLKRFELMGELNPEFVRQTDEFLARLEVAGADEFKALLRQCRDLMRDDADRC